LRAVLFQNEEKAKRFTEGPQPELKIGYGSVTAANNIKSAIAYHKLMQEKRAKEEGSK
jgi:3-deoxy-D-manno-octulosonic-acid transferase